MRRWGCGLLLACAATAAAAGDFDTAFLRGSTTDLPVPHPYVRWSGLYAGGQVGADFHGSDFTNATTPSIANIVSQDAILQQVPVAKMPQLPSIVSSSPSLGAFVGYNYQIDDVVLGLEGNFNWTRLDENVADTVSRGYFVTYNQHIFATQVNTVVSAGASSSQYGDFRARAGWAFDCFLPYAFIGASIGQIDTYQSTNVNYKGVDVTPQTGPGTPGILPNVGGTYTLAGISQGKYVIGFAAGLGVDYALWQHVFLRGEVEYLSFGQQNGIKLDTVTARVGAGVKF